MISYLLHILLFSSSVCIGIDLVDDGRPPEMLLDCPTLSCEENKLPSDVCYSHDAEASASVIKGQLCYDAETAKQTDLALVCPFNTVDYMWIDELLQG